MTVPATDRRAGPFTGTGVIVPLPFDFKVFAQEDLLVTRTSVDGLESVLSLGADYTVTLNPDQDADPGGVVTPLVAPPIGVLTTITTALPYEQPLDLQGGGSFRPQVIENEFDYVVMLLQQLKEQADRSLQLPVSSDASPHLPAPEANKVIGWNPDASALQNYSIEDLASVIAAGSWDDDLFSGNGVLTQFVLMSQPASVESLFVYISGVRQYPNVDYTLAGTTLTFTSPPPFGANNIYAVWGRAAVLGYSDAGVVNWIQQGGGAVTQSVQSTLRRRISVTDFGAVLDGVTDDTAAITLAVASAIARSADLYWPMGAANTTASIPNFHSVKHYGPGRIVRGADTFYIEPTNNQTNTFYIATTGNDANDGLSAAQPRQLFQTGVDTLVAWAHALGTGVWGIKLAAGQYARARFPDDGLWSANPLHISGPTVAHPGVPTALIKEGATQSGVGLLANLTKIYVDSVKFEDYNGSTSSAGIRGSVVYTNNVHATDCYYGVLAGNPESLLNVKGGIFDDCGYLNSVTIVGAGGAGVYAIFGTKIEIGEQNAGTLALGPIFRNSVNGFHCKEYVDGHIDWCTFEDNATGVNLWTLSRANLDGSSFKRNDKAIRTVSGSYADPSTNTVFGTGVDANQLIVTTGINCNSGGEMALLEGNYPLGNTEYRFKTSAPNTVVTSTSSANTIDSYTPRAGFFSGPALTGVPSKKMRIHVKGTLAGTTGTYKRIAVRLGASTVVFVSFASTLVGDFEADIEVDFISTANQVLSVRGVCHGFPVLFAIGNGTVDMTVDQVLALQAYVQNAADSITIKFFEWFISGV